MGTVLFWIPVLMAGCTMVVIGFIFLEYRKGDLKWHREPVILLLLLLLLAGMLYPVYVDGIARRNREEFYRSNPHLPRH